MDMTKAHLVTAENMMEIISPANGTDFTLEELQKFVDGWIEIIHINKDVIMVVNEEGRYCKSPNGMATVIAIGHEIIPSGDNIYGDVVICPSPMVK